MRWRTAGGIDWGIGNSGDILYFISSTAADTSAAASYPMVIDGGNGNVGIGTTSPPGHLQVASQNRAVSVLDSGTSNYAEIGFTTLGADAPAFGFLTGYDIQVKTGTTRGGLAIAMHVDNDGAVGFGGQTAPAFTVDVSGSLRATGYIQTDEVRDNTGQQLILGAGESQGKFTGHTNEYVYVEAEQGLMVSTPSVSNFGSGYTEWQTIIRGGPADGGIRMGQWGSSSTYNFIGTVNYSGGEYTLLMSSTSTYLSCGSGGTVFIRPTN